MDVWVVGWLYKQKERVEEWRSWPTLFWKQYLIQQCPRNMSSSIKVRFNAGFDVLKKIAPKI